MTNDQIVAIAAPMVFNGVLVGLLMAYINAKFAAVDEKFKGVNQRFDDMRDLWRAELRRVEEIIDARLKHLEEK